MFKNINNPNNKNIVAQKNNKLDGKLLIINFNLFMIKLYHENKKPTKVGFYKSSVSGTNLEPI